MVTPWVHSFSVTETELYRGKFTIYRITSVIFPADNPGAVSCVSIWKRYSEVKELYQKVRKRVKRDRLPVQLPVLAPDRSYFNRFHSDVIEGRRQWILDLLECIGTQPALYSYAVFTKFLQSGYTPQSTAAGVPGGDVVDGIFPPPSESDASEDPSSSSLAEDQMSITTTTSSQAAVAARELPVQPRFSADYIVEATERFNEAVQLEVNDKYEEALARYKDGIEVLMAGIPDEPDDSRRRIAKVKVDKYLSRSENIYKHFLGPPRNDHTISKAPTAAVGSSNRELPLHQLSKYKVIRVLDENVMAVQEVMTRRFFVIKSIDRTEDWGQGIEGGNDVAYMVHLVAYFVAECVIFLLLQPASGGRLMDYIEAYNAKEEETVQAEEICTCEPNVAAVPAYESLSPDVDIDELLTSSQKLLDSVQKTLDQTVDMDTKERGPVAKEENICLPCRIPEECVRQFAKELVVAVDALHSRDIILGHLATRNLLLGKGGQLLLTYYHHRNYSQVISKHSFCDNVVLAPERTTTMDSDWYSVGVVLYELLTGQSFLAHHPDRWCYFELQLPGTDPPLSLRATSLLQGLLAEDPGKRLTFREICWHPFFNKVIVD